MTHKFPKTITCLCGELLAVTKRFIDKRVQGVTSEPCKKCGCPGASEYIYRDKAKNDEMAAMLREIIGR